MLLTPVPTSCHVLYNRIIFVGSLPACKCTNKNGLQINLYRFPPPPCSNPQLQFVEEVALPPPEVQIDLAEQERNQKELDEAIHAPLPADEDDELID